MIPVSYLLWTVCAEGGGILGACLALTNVINYYWSKLWAHFLLYQVNTSHLCSLNILFLNTHICRLTRQGQTGSHIPRTIHINLTYCIFFRSDLQHIEHDGIETLLQLWWTLITERIWAAALLKQVNTHKHIIMQLCVFIDWDYASGKQNGGFCVVKNKVAMWRDKVSGLWRFSNGCGFVAEPRNQRKLWWLICIWYV